MQAHLTVSREEWLKARRAHLAKEKALLKAQEALRQETRALPWVKVEKEYVFEGPDGRETLGELFAGRGQLIVKHFMMGPGWQEGCLGCSFGADQYDGSVVHLAHHRMGWHFKWVSSFGSDFNYDFNVSFTEADLAEGKALYNFEPRRDVADEMAGMSVFYRDDRGDIFHTYSVFARGSEQVAGVYGLLDVTPRGRNEPPGGNLTHWVRRHDKYEEKNR
jgi:predicted dithiol-disulfide oxidoreductase (DUF899 family)